MTEESDALDVIYDEVTAADTEIDDAVESLLKEIHALRAERDALRTLIKAAYWEGAAEYAGASDAMWLSSDACKALAVQP